MPNSLKQLCIVVLALLAGVPAWPQTDWQVASAAVSFKIKNAGIGTQGGFSGFGGKILFDPDALETSRLEASVDAKTIDTGIGLRDNHLRKEEYFHADKYPKITMKSVRIVRAGGNAFTGTFQLTIKAVTRKVDIPFTFVQSGNGARLKGDFIIDRRAYGVGRNHFTLSDNATISIDLRLAKPPA